MVTLRARVRTPSLDNYRSGVPLAPAGGAALNIGLGLTQNVSREGGNTQPPAARMGTLRTRVRTPSLDNYRSGVPWAPAGDVALPNLRWPRRSATAHYSRFHQFRQNFRNLEHRAIIDRGRISPVPVKVRRLQQFDQTGLNIPKRLQHHA